MNFAEKLIAVADNRSKLYNKGRADFGVSFDENGIDLVSIRNVHPKEHDVEVTTDSESISVIGKNLIPYPYYQMSKETNGITFVVNEDGTVTANGTATAQAYIIISNKATLGLANGTYCLSGVPLENNEDNKCYITYASYVQDGRKDGTIIDINESTAQNMMTCVVQAGKKVENFIFKPMLEVGAKVSEFDDLNTVWGRLFLGRGLKNGCAQA